MPMGLGSLVGHATASRVAQLGFPGAPPLLCRHRRARAANRAGAAVVEELQGA